VNVLFIRGTDLKPKPPVTLGVRERGEECPPKTSREYPLMAQMSQIKPNAALGAFHLRQLRHLRKIEGEPASLTAE